MTLSEKISAVPRNAGAKGAGVGEEMGGSTHRRCLLACAEFIGMRAMQSARHHRH